MDRVVEALVRLVSLIAGWARYLPALNYARYVPGEPLKVLLVGYNGARNTGSDVRVASLARQLKELLGGYDVQVSVMSLDAANTAAYFDEDVRQVQFPTLFFFDLLKACSHNHVAILCEGSTFKSKFANALTLYSCEAAGIMRAQGKPCIAYGSEVGEMEPAVERAVHDLCSEVRFAMRSAGSLKALRGLGFDGYLGTDTAWRFDSSRGDEAAYELLRAGGWDGERPLLGIAAINPFCWPVRPSLAKFAHACRTGDRKLQFQGLYFFSWSDERERRFQAYLDALAQACSTFAAERGFQPVIFGMEQLDGQACELLSDRLGGDVPLLVSSECDVFVMSAALRSLSLLVTSRYHAQVISAASQVPAVAVTMDERLTNLTEELGTDSELLLSVNDPDLAPRLLVALDRAWDNADAVRAQIAQGVQVALARLDGMGEWLRAQVGEALLGGRDAVL